MKYLREVTALTLLFINIIEVSANINSYDSYKSSGEIDLGLVQLQIDSEIDKYLKDVKRLLGNRPEQDGGHRISKRNSLNEATFTKAKGLHVFEGFQEWFPISAQFADDIVLFCIHDIFSEDVQKEHCYAAALLSAMAEVHPEISAADKLVLYKFNGSHFLESDAVNVTGGQSLATQTIHGVQYIVVAESYTTVDEFDSFSVSPVFKVNVSTGLLEQCQPLGDRFLRSVAIWEQKGMNVIFLAAATSSTENSTVDTESHVYRWMGSYFDKVDTIRTFSPKCFTPFTVGSVMYLAVANNRNDMGETDIDSMIFMYNLHEERFFLHQKLRTHAAMDIKYFSFEEDSKKESFLAVANHFEKDKDDKKNYDTCSVIYKLLDDENFIPFQCIRMPGASNWLPITESDGKFLLVLASSLYGVKAFQYDGWRFVETRVQNNKGTFGPGIVSMRQFHFNNLTVFTVANKKNEGGNIFTVEYKKDDRLPKFVSNVLNWCRNISSELEAAIIDVNRLNSSVQDAPRLSDTRIRINGSIIFQNTTSLETVNINISNATLDDTISECKGFPSLRTILDDVSELNKTMERPGPTTVVFDENVELEAAEFECKSGCGLNELRIDRLNDESFNDFLSNSYISFENSIFQEKIHNLEFEKLAVQSPIVVNNVNGHNFDDLMFAEDVGNTVIPKVIVYGNVSLGADLMVRNKVDDVRIDRNSVILNDGDQDFSDSSIEVACQIKVRNLTVRSTFNGIQIESSSSRSISKRETISTLTTKELYLADDMISGISFSDFVNNTLKHYSKQSPQIVSGVHEYDHLIANDVTGQYLPPPETFPEIYYQPVNYPEDSDYENWALVGENHTRDNSTDHKRLSYISGNGTSSNPKKKEDYGIGKKKRPKIVGKGKMITILRQNDQTFIGDVTVRGKVIIENATVYASNIILEKENVSIGDILTHGVRLNSTALEHQNLIFNAPVKFERLNVKSINNIQPENWIRKDNTSKEVRVTGHKRIGSSVNLKDGATVSGKINGIDFKNLLTNTLQVDGSQEVTGKKLIGAVTVDNIESGSFDLVPDAEESRKTADTYGDVTVDKLKLEVLYVKGLVNGVDLDMAVQDTVYKDGKYYFLKGNTLFTGNLTVDNLTCDNIEGLDVKQIRRSKLEQRSIKEDDGEFVNLTADLLNGKSLIVHRLNYTGQLDGVDANEFGNWLLKDGDQVVSGQQFIGSMNATRGVNLTSGFLNSVNISSIAEQALRIDTPAALSSVDFEGKVISNREVKVGGLLNGEKFSKSELVLKPDNEEGVDGDSDESGDIVFTGEKTLNAGLSANSVTSDWLDKFCSFVTGYEGKKEWKPETMPVLTVNGSVYFSSEPKVVLLNGYNLSSVIERVWFKNEDKSIPEKTSFTDIVFENDISLHGLLNTHDLAALEQNYFSLTKDQKVTGEFHFGRLIIDGYMNTDKIEAYATVSGLNFDNFAKSVLLNGTDQVLIGLPYFENIIIKGSLDGHVNDLDIRTDVMRWDVDRNEVKEALILSNMKVSHLMTEPGNIVNIQHVNITEWEHLAVRKHGPFKIRGNKTFTGSLYVENDVSVVGLINGNKFDDENVLLDHGDQVLTGFNRFDIGSQLNVTNLITERNVNGINMSDLIEKQVYKSSNIVIQGNKTLLSPLTAESIYLTRQFDTIDLVHLYEELTAPEKFMAYDYAKEIDTLQTIRSNIEKSLTGRAFRLKQWRKVQSLSGRTESVLFLKHSNSVNGTQVTAAIIRDLGKSKKVGYEIKLVIYNWNNELQKFVREGKGVWFRIKPIIIYAVKIDDNTESGSSKLFTLFKNDIANPEGASPFTGLLYDIKNTSSEIENNSHTTNSMRPVHNLSIDMLNIGSLVHLSDTCYLLWQFNVSTCSIYCEKQLLNNISCNNLTQVVSFTDGPMKYIGIGKAVEQPVVEVWSWDRTKKMKQVLIIPTGMRPDHISMIAHQNWRQYFLAVSSGSQVTVTRFDMMWEYLDSFTSSTTSDASVILSVLTTDEVIMYVMSSCAAPAVWRWSGISKPKVIALPIVGTQVKQIFDFTDKTGGNYTIVVTDNETAVLKATFLTEN